MKIIETEFTKELSSLLAKHKKTFDADKNGIYIVDDPNKTIIYTTESETASEDSRPKMIFGIQTLA
jgi:hypothetical protein